MKLGIYDTRALIVAFAAILFGTLPAVAHAQIWGSVTNTVTNSGTGIVNNLANQNTALINNTVNSTVNSGINSVLGSITGSPSSSFGGSGYSNAIPASYNPPTTFPLHVTTVSSGAITGSAQAAQNCTDTMTAINADKGMQMGAYASKVTASQYMGNSGINNTLSQQTQPTPLPSFDIMGFLINIAQAEIRNIAMQMINNLRAQIMQSVGLSSNFGLGQRNGMLNQFGIQPVVPVPSTLQLTSLVPVPVPSQGDPRGTGTVVTAPTPPPTIVYVPTK
jgi:hypothetical protein